MNPNPQDRSEFWLLMLGFVIALLIFGAIQAGIILLLGHKI